MLKKSRDIDINMHIYLAVHYSVTVNSLWPQGQQHARLPCPSPTLEACSNLCPLSWWWHPIILSSVIPFSPCLQYFPALVSFLMSQLFEQMAKVLQLQFQHQNIQGDFPWSWLVWSPCSSRDSQSSPGPQFESISSSYQVAKILDLQHQTFQWNVQYWFPLALTGLIS